MDEQILKQAEVMYSTVCKALDAMEINYERFNEDFAVSFNYSGEDMVHSVVIKITPHLCGVTMFVPFSFKIDDQAESDVLRAISWINSWVEMGNFSYDENAKTIFFKMSLMYRDSLMSENVIVDNIVIMAGIIERYDDKLIAINKGYLSVDEFLKNEE